jgi:hypothetical protein
MFMILEKLAKAIHRQSWFTVILEILIVVIGIFIGLQVDDWNSSRKDRLDERVFLLRLHSDMVTADGLSIRVRKRRLDQVERIIRASDVLFERADRYELAKDECNAIGSANLFNIAVPSLPAFDELIGTGRLGIIRDAELRGALIKLEQTRTALVVMVATQSSQPTFTHLPSDFPGLLQMESYYDDASKEIRVRMTCDVAGMRSNQRFLNQWAINADGYDAYVRDGLLPWVTQFEKTHQVVDVAIDADHGGTD